MSQMLTNTSKPPAEPKVRAVEPIDRVWTLDEYHRLIRDGYFVGQRCEFIEGTIVYMSPQRPPHGGAIELIDEYLRRAFANGFRIRSQLPFSSADGSEPEPDFAVIEGEDRRSATRDHPKSAVLIIEISETTLHHDRRKARQYASSGVADYWILNLSNRTLEVYREPMPAAGAPDGPAYGAMRVVNADQSIAPLRAPDALVKVADLLP